MLKLDVGCPNSDPIALRCLFLQEDLVDCLGRWSPIPVTYCGGARSLEDIERVHSIGEGKVRVLPHPPCIPGRGTIYFDVLESHLPLLPPVHRARRHANACPTTTFNPPPFPPPAPATLLHWIAALAG